MRFSLSTGSLLCAVLLVSLSCHYNIEGQPDPTPVIPPCRIVKATYKTLYISGPKTDYEQLTLNGKTYDIYKWSETTYTYDEKGRIILDSTTTWGGTATRRYTYFKPKIVTNWLTTDNSGSIIQTSKDSILLNAQGYNDTYLYSEQGLRLTYKSWAKTAVTKVEANNLIYHSEEYNGGRLITTYEFDYTRPGLLPIYQYMGAGDQNLRTVYLKSTVGVPYLNDGPAYRIDYQYIFDDSGRVKRQIQLDTRYPDSYWPFITNQGGIKVTDFEYACQ